MGASRGVVTPEEGRKAEFLKQYFPTISRIKWFFIKILGKKTFGTSGISRQHYWIWYEFRGKRYYAGYSYYGRIIYKRK